jgi:hypothetical protein
MAACGGAAPAPAAPTPRASPGTHIRTEPDRPPIDPIVALTPTDDAEVSWVIPGPMQLELGGTVLEAAGP